MRNRTADPFTTRAGHVALGELTRAGSPPLWPGRPASSVRCQSYSASMDSPAEPQVQVVVNVEREESDDPGGCGDSCFNCCRCGCLMLVMLVIVGVGLGVLGALFG